MTHPSPNFSSPSSEDISPDYSPDYSPDLSEEISPFYSHHLSPAYPDRGDLKAYQDLMAQVAKPRLAEGTGITSLSRKCGPTNDPISGALLGGALGGVAPGIFGAGSWIVGALLGASLGYRMGLMLQRGKSDPKKDEQFAKSFTITGGNQALVSKGQPLPLVYGNRLLNPSGGCRWGGYLIGSLVQTVKGQQTLNQVYALGLGELGSLSETDTLIDGQERALFSEAEITLYFRPGTPNQTPLPILPGYCQTLNPNTNAFLGCDKRASSKSDLTVIQSPTVTWQALTNCFLNGSTVTKNAGASAWDATGQTNVTLSEYGGYISWKVPTASHLGMVGLSAGAISQSMSFGIRFGADSQFQVWESGTMRYNSESEAPGARTYAPNDSWRVEVATGGNVTYKRNGVAFYTSTVTNPPLPLRGALTLYSPGASIYEATFSGTVTLQSGNLSSSGTGTIQIDEGEEWTKGDYDRFTLSEEYAIVTDSEVKPFRLVAKNDQTKTLTLSPSLSVESGDSIWAIYTAKWATTKPVTRIDFNLEANLFARLKPTQEDSDSKK